MCAHVQKMKGYIDRLGNLHVDFPNELAIDMVLNSLSSAYKQFIVNFNMNSMEKTLMELHGMLKSAEVSMGKPIQNASAPVLAIREGGYKKKKVSFPKGKGKSKVSHNHAKKRKTDSEIAPVSDPSEAVCFYCQQKGHWKRSCPKYLEDLKNNKAKGIGTSGIFMIELHNTTSSSDSWVLDTGCGTHICSKLQGLKESRTLEHGELNLIMGNRKTVAVTKIGTYELMLGN